MKTIASNKKVYFEYEVKEKLQAGIVLLGTEIKSVRNGDVSLAGSYCVVMRNELYVKNFMIKPYENAGFVNHDPLRDKKLLITKKELRKICKFIEVPGQSIVPISLFLNDKNRAKLEIASVRGKKLFDKRETIKQRDNKIALDRVKKRMNSNYE